MADGKAGAPLGNNNAGKNKLWREAIDKAIKQDDGKRLRKAAESLLDQAAAGEAWAIKEFGDRLDGKPAQAIVGADGGDLTVISRIERVIIDNPKD